MHDETSLYKTDGSVVRHMADKLRTSGLLMGHAVCIVKNINRTCRAEVLAAPSGLKPLSLGQRFQPSRQGGGEKKYYHLPLRLLSSFWLSVPGFMVHSPYFQLNLRGLEASSLSGLNVGLLSHIFNAWNLDVLTSTPVSSIHCFMFYTCWNSDVSL